jgi:cation diffusion facilitator family transporter
LTLGLNWIVASLKILIGLSTQCMMVVADGLHSFSDGTSNIVGLVAMSIARHPADEDHPYGHQKFETIAAALIACLLFAVAFGILKESVVVFFHPKEPQVNAISFLVMGGTFLVNLFVVWYERREGKRLNSDLLISDSWHTFTDLFITISVIVGLIALRLKVPHLDAVFSFCIGLFIIVTAVMILKHASGVLVDKAVIEPDRIRRIAMSVEGIQDCHEIRTRGRLDSIYVDLRVLVDPGMSVMDSHRLAHVIENNIRGQISGVHDVVVHVEPSSHEHKAGAPD